MIIESRLRYIEASSKMARCVYVCLRHGAESGHNNLIACLVSDMWSQVEIKALLLALDRPKAR